MTTPDQTPQYPQQPQAQAAQGYYQAPQQAYQQATASVPYTGYAAPKPSPIIGGIWGVILLSLAGLLTLIGLIAMIVALAGDGITSGIVAGWLLPPALIVDGLFLSVQALGTKK
jgi:hypothetical protein